MYCPICSSEVFLDQKFCRSCGFGLEKITQSVSEYHATEAARNLREQNNKLDRLAIITLSIFSLGVSGFFLYSLHGWLIGYVVNRTTELLSLLALMVIFVCGLLSVLFSVKTKDLQGPSTKGNLQPEELRESAASAAFLQKNHFDPIPSVTERTTKLLFTKKEEGGANKGN